jgi:hypothetical protein
MPADAEKRICTGCGCTEDRACTISVVVSRPTDQTIAVIERGCSWSADNPKLCTACEALYGGNESETEMLIDLFPAEFNPFSNSEALAGSREAQRAIVRKSRCTKL